MCTEVIDNMGMLFWIVSDGIPDIPHQTDLNENKNTQIG